ncbi:hypothetical protein QWZ13_15140 [Reinekea marina]|uniref:Lipoprotein n=1 Tax=Reinekea marina TaxID=1310421 RepID=A0ABV7WSQ7_9GAMM|nr:hypothetical protein [Reinekea marina]MDN3650251.1 hypothetical protein [Reinekea marina]
MEKLLIKIAVKCAFVLLVAACASDDEGSGTNSDTEDAIEYQRISGTSALGRPGRWATNCLGTACAGSNSEGFYLLSAEVDAASLMFSDIPEADGTTIRLHGLYRHDAERSSSMVNFNPSTQAILDAYSQYSSATSIDECALEATCSQQLLTGFTTDVEETMISQLSTLMGAIWPENYNPFSDVYIADPNPASPTYTALDQMHDMFDFVVADGNWQVLDNNGDLISSVPLDLLMINNPNAITPLTDEQLTRAAALDVPPPPSGNPITLIYQTSPSLAAELQPPASFAVDASRSRSLNPGDLLFSHELTDPEGFRVLFEGAGVSTTLEKPGNHVWLIRATDSAQATLVQGFVIRVAADENADPIFGGDGSCYTPSPLSANQLNYCIETQNGGRLGACEPINSGSIVTQFSPAPCASEVQNDGALFGVCTIEASELRYFLYDNLNRPNNADSFQDKQQDTADLCRLFFQGDWSDNP